MGGIRMRTFLNTTLLVLAATFALCFLAFYNGFPIVYPDSGTYIDSGFTGNLPADRPIFYGLFLRHVSLAESPWLVILMQAGILGWLLLLTLKRFVAPARLPYYYLPTILFLVGMTGVSYYADMLIPDIFTPILFLSAFQLMYWDQQKWANRITLVLVAMLALITHLSNFPTILAALGACLVIYWFRRKKGESPFKRRSVIILVSLIGLMYLFVPFYNWTQNGQYRYAPGGSIFMTNRLLDLGIVRDFLDEDCPNQNWKLCLHKDDSYSDFLWDFDRSPLYKTGGWEANFEEYQRMNNAILRRPNYLLRFARAGIEDGLRQFFVFTADPSTVIAEETAPNPQIRLRFKSSLRSWLGSKQAHQKLDLNRLNGRQEVVVLISFTFLLLIAIDRRRFVKLPADLRWLATALLLFSLSSCFVCASLSVVDSRYQGRIVWLFPFLVLLILFHYSEQNDWPGKVAAKLRKSASPEETLQ
jgi:hypothetical protein